MDPVTIVGTGPAADAVVDTLADESIPHERRDEPDFSSTTLGVVVDHVGADVFARANETAREAQVPWVAIELGGIGGYPIVDASVAGLEPAGPCYQCLARRVEANAESDAEPVAAPDSGTARFAGAIAGRELVTLLDPDRARPIDRSDEPILGRVIEIPYAERTVLGLPGCTCGSAPDGVLRHEGPSLDLDAALAQADRGLDGRVGIVAQVGEAESYPAPYYLAELCDTSGFSDATAPNQAAGVAPGWDEAFMKALGESFERYAAGVYRTDSFVRATAAELDDCVPPEAFVAPADGGALATDGGPNSDDDAGGTGGDDVEGTETVTDQNSEETTAWYPAEELATGIETHVPANLVVHPPPSSGVRPPITTGLGLGSSGADALLSGLYEVIERDATMLAWYSTYEPLGLTVEDDQYRTLARRVEGEGLSIQPLLLTQDVDVPVVAVAVYRDSYPKLAFGSAAHLDPHTAARDALAEAVQNWMELRTMGAEAAAEANGAIGRYATDPEPTRPWLDPETVTAAETVGPKDPPSGASAVDTLIERLANADLSAYAARTTTRDLLALGFEGVRVLVPSAQPLFLGDPYFGERAETVPESLGFEPRQDREHHPFP